jgi:DNA-binding transcriptional ArsR family regulator
VKSSASADPTKRAGDEQIDRWCREEESNLPTYGFSRTYLSQLAHHLGTTPSSLQRELPSLAKAGIFEERRNGTRTYFRAQQASPTFRNLRGIFAKTQEDRKNPQSPSP